MSDTLVESLKKVPMRCADCGDTTFEERECPENRDGHLWETDDAAMARAVRAYLAERVTREKIVALMSTVWATYETHPRWAILLPSVGRACALHPPISRLMRAAGPGSACTVPS